MGMNGETGTQARWRFWMDTGGTFTDCLAVGPDGREHRLKVLSSGAVRARVDSVSDTGVAVLAGLPVVPDGFFAGFEVRRVSGGETSPEGEGGVGRVENWFAGERAAVIDGLRLEAGDVVNLSCGEEAPVLAMRLFTGTAPGEAFPPSELRLATTRGTNALLEGRGARVALFVTAGFADLLRIGDQRRPDLFALEVRKPAPLHGPVVEVHERLAADGSVIRPPDLERLRTAAASLVNEGIDVAAVALLHSYRNPSHEAAVARVLREAGFRHVSVSSELAPLIKIVPRAETAVVDAVLAPIMESYLGGVETAVERDRFYVMTSAGGLVPRAAYRPKDSLLSGPAGGVAGAAAAARRAGCARLLTFDMGGTSTDVARYDGDFDYRFEHRVGPARVFAPALHVESVAAGGGSICRFDGAALVVGPESAGASPGPACYGAGGPLTLTDVNLLLGRLDPTKFGIPVFPEASEARLREVLEAIREATGSEPERESVLRGFLEIANERMADAIRRISVREGYDPAEYTLVAFGGAGGLHACAVAERLGVRAVVFPADSGLLSARGLREAVPERFVERQVLQRLEAAADCLDAWVRELETEAGSALAADGVAAEAVEVRRREAELRFDGQESVLTVNLDGAGALVGEAVAERFREAYRRRYGHVPGDRAVELVTLRVVVSERRGGEGRERFAAAGEAGPAGRQRAHARESLSPGMRLAGPTLVQDRFSTLCIAEGWTAVVGSEGTIRLERAAAPGARIGAAAETAAGADGDGGRAEVVDLELFTCRFLALVDEMGMLLQRCAVSVNVKERLDFSCALLDPDGELVANAPHIPVHLGALGECVRRVRAVLDLAPGDIAITNHPGYGGSHLPDVTLIAPVYAADGSLLGYVANRAHHAEIGGARPGSMPPGAASLAEEGVVIAPRLLMRGGEADWEGLRRLLGGGPFPSRAVEENIADLHAQVAALRCGADALERLAAEAGADRVRRFMRLLKDRAAAALAAALERVPHRGERRAADAMDDGSPIVVTVRKTAGERLVVDFSGTAPVHPGNLNATPAIVRSAVIYVLRLLAGADLPLNEGLMRDVDLHIPPGMLAPDFPDDPAACPAVVGGNVETSQRVVDVLLTALGLAACSQGTMNNVIFGNAHFSYYETVAGGSGAGPGFPGEDAVHCHMTNTAITDAEVLEHRLPVRLERFAVRAGSGGAGRWRGGCGVERVLRFLESVALSVLTQRRVRGAPGLDGGEAGAPGRQWLERRDGARVDLGPIDGVEAEAGDVFHLLTPGGGGCGADA